MRKKKKTLHQFLYKNSNALKIFLIKQNSHLKGASPTFFQALSNKLGNSSFEDQWHREDFELLVSGISELMVGFIKNEKNLPVFFSHFSLTPQGT